MTRIMCSYETSSGSRVFNVMQTKLVANKQFNEALDNIKVNISRKLNASQLVLDVSKLDRLMKQRIQNRYSWQLNNDMVFQLKEAMKVGIITGRSV